MSIVISKFAKVIAKMKKKKSFLPPPIILALSNAQHLQ
jgi:hypothetical protein